MIKSSCFLWVRLFLLLKLFLLLTSNVHQGEAALRRNLKVPIAHGEDLYDDLIEGSESVELYSEESETDEDDRGKHPCQRTCKKGKPLTCRYKFDVEYYFTMSKACYNCPFNKTECDLQYCVTGDGVRRTILAVNKQLPGPLIDACYGDTIEVEVNNLMLDISTTIHWHGILQKDTPFMDGVPFVSQCLIPPQGSFLYRFYADNPGTHLWHAHSALQRGDGIYGPLVVRLPPEDDPHDNLYHFDLPEHVVTIIDWSHLLSADKFMAHYLSKGDNKPPSILVNGKGRYEEYKRGENIVFTPVEKFTVKPGHRYRFRLINAGFLNCPVQMTIDDHLFTVIASDGGDLMPKETSALVSVAGERFDFVLEANQPIGNYWIRFKGLLDCGVKSVIQVAVLHYEGAEDKEPDSDVTYENSVPKGLSVNAVNTPLGTEGALLMSELPALVPAEDPILKPEADVKVYLAYDFNPVENYHFNSYVPSSSWRKGRTPQISHISMQFPNFPVMADLQRASTLSACNSSSVSMNCRFEFCECPHIINVPLNAVVEAVLIDEGVPFDANHPMHLHGYVFKLIGMDRLGSQTSEEEVRKLDEEGLLKRNLVNPPSKDTITIPDGGYAIIRFHATNPGFWIMHCHLDFHVEMGMALLFRVGEPEDFRPPPADLPLCGDPFRPVPVNQTERHLARFFPRKGIYQTHNDLILGINKTSSLRVSVLVVFVLLLYPLVIV